MQDLINDVNEDNQQDGNIIVQEPNGGDEEDISDEEEENYNLHQFMVNLPEDSGELNMSLVFIRHIIPYENTFIACNNKHRLGTCWSFGHCSCPGTR